MTILGVVSGAGGVGCSTLTAALGVPAAAGGWRVVDDLDAIVIRPEGGGTQT